MEKDNFFSRMDLSIKEHLLMETLQDKEDIFLIMVVYMREVLNKTMHLVLEHIAILFKDIIMKDNGLEMFLQEKENKNFQMVHIIRDNFQMEQKTDMEGMFQIQEFMKDNLKMEVFTEKEVFLMLIIVLLQEIGLMEL